MSKDRDSRAISARPVLRKGRASEDAVDQVAEGIRRRGHCGWALLKTESGLALIGPRQGVADALANASGSASPQIVLERPSAHGPQAKGSVENPANQLKH
eukprot:3462895-Alexandrium_andersonii.AAC.1